MLKWWNAYTTSHSVNQSTKWIVVVRSAALNSLINNLIWLYWLIINLWRIFIRASFSNLKLRRRLDFCAVTASLCEQANLSSFIQWCSLLLLFVSFPFLILNTIHLKHIMRLIDVCHCHSLEITKSLCVWACKRFRQMYGIINTGCKWHVNFNVPLDFIYKNGNVCAPRNMVKLFDISFIEHNFKMMRNKRWIKMTKKKLPKI